MKVLLTTLNAKYIHMNLAIRILYDLNYEKHPELRWKEFSIKEKLDGVAEYCSHFRVVAFSCYIWNIQQTLQVCRRIKALRKDVYILLGGPEVSHDAVALMENKDIDAVICGEGEIPFSAFLEHFPDPSTVPQLVWRKGEDIHYNNFPAPNYIFSREKPLLPYRHEPQQDLYNKISYIETSRGCPYKCEFCLASLDNNVRFLPEEVLKENLLYLMNHGRVIKFLDRTFNVRKSFTIDMFRFILANHNPGNIFQFEITADIVHPDIISFIQKEVPRGLFRFEIGIQTVNKEANLAVKRKQDFEKTRQVILALRDKVDMHLDLIVGLPLDNEADVIFSIEQVFALYPDELQLGFLKFLKGTPMRKDAEKHGYRFDPNPPYEIIRSDYLDEQALASFRLAEHMLEVFWNKGRAKRTLKHISETASIFVFLRDLGRFFVEKVGWVGFGEKEAYGALLEFILMDSGADEIIAERLVFDFYARAATFPGVEFAEKALLDSGKIKRDGKKIAIRFSDGYTIFEYKGNRAPEIVVLQD